MSLKSTWFSAIHSQKVGILGKSRAKKFSRTDVLLTQSSAFHVGDSRNAARHVCAAFRNGKRIFVMQRPYLLP